MKRWLFTKLRINEQIKLGEVVGVTLAVDVQHRLHNRVTRQWPKPKLLADNRSNNSNIYNNSNHNKEYILRSFDMA
jgi:hypothetical protein